MNFCPAVTLTVVVELSLLRTVIEKLKSLQKKNLSGSYRKN